MGEAMTREEVLRASAAYQIKTWWLRAPIYDAQIRLYRRIGAFDDANGLAEVVHQYENGNPIISDDYRGMP